MTKSPLNISIIVFLPGKSFNYPIFQLHADVALYKCFRALLWVEFRTFRTGFPNPEASAQRLVIKLATVHKSTSRHHVPSLPRPSSLHNDNFPFRSGCLTTQIWISNPRKRKGKLHRYNNFKFYEMLPRYRMWQCKPSYVTQINTVSYFAMYLLHRAIPTHCL